MASPLTKSGYPNSRNLAKKFRSQRIDENGNIHWQDNMRLGNAGQSVNSTSCFGVKSTFGVRAQQFGPKKGKRRDKTRKHTCRLVCSQDLLRLKSEKTPTPNNTRRKILKLRLIGDHYGRQYVNSKLQRHLNALSERVFNVVFLSSDLIKNIEEEDRKLENEVKDEIKMCKVNPLMIKNLIKEIHSDMEKLNKIMR